MNKVKTLKSLFSSRALAATVAGGMLIHSTVTVLAASIIISACVDGDNRCLACNTAQGEVRCVGHFQGDPDNINYFYCCGWTSPTNDPNPNITYDQCGGLASKATYPYADAACTDQ